MFLNIFQKRVCKGFVTQNRGGRGDCTESRILRRFPGKAPCPIGNRTYKL